MTRRTVGRAVIGLLAGIVTFGCASRDVTGPRDATLKPFGSAALQSIALRGEELKFHVRGGKKWTLYLYNGEIYSSKTGNRLPASATQKEYLTTIGRKYDQIDAFIATYKGQPGATAFDVDDQNHPKMSLAELSAVVRRSSEILSKQRRSDGGKRPGGTPDASTLDDGANCRALMDLVNQIFSAYMDASEQLQEAFDLWDSTCYVPPQDPDMPPPPPPPAQTCREISDLIDQLAAVHASLFAQLMDAIGVAQGAGCYGQNA